MKKLLVVLLVLALVGMPVVSFAGWVTANQITCSWDANDTSDIDAATERLVYEVFLTNAVTDPGKTNPTSVGVTAETSLQITLANKGKYRAGVCAVLQALAEDGVTWEEVARSEVSWSDDPTVTLNGEIFGIRFYPAPQKPAGLNAG